MSSSNIIASNNKIYDSYLPNPYPYPAQANSLAQVLIAGNDAGNQDAINFNTLEATNLNSTILRNPLGTLALGDVTLGATNITGTSVSAQADSGLTLSTVGVLAPITATSVGLMTLTGNAGISLLTGGGLPLNISSSGVIQCNATSNLELVASTGSITLVPTAGSVGVGTVTPNANAILDCTSVTKAFLPPRMTTAEKNAIAVPTAGMVVYDSTLNKLCVRTASAWETITSV